MTGAAKLVEHGLALVPLKLAARWRSGGEVNDFWNLRHTIVDARQRIRFVINDDEDL